MPDKLETEGLAKALQLWGGNPIAAPSARNALQHLPSAAAAAALLAAPLRNVCRASRARLLQVCEVVSERTPAARSGP